MEKKKKIKILLIDDDQMMRIYFRDIFWIHGGDDKYEVNMVPTLAEAEKIVMNEETTPDTIFLDVMMPIEGQNNSPQEQMQRTISFIERIRKNHPNKDKETPCKMKIVIYSGQKDKAIENEFKKIGVDGYLIKGDLMPKDIIDFTNKIHECNN